VVSGIFLVLDADFVFNWSSTKTPMSFSPSEFCSSTSLPSLPIKYKVSIQNKENTGNHTEISCIKEEVDVDIVAESQRPQMT
jgi:hypothetical protein